MTLGELLTHDIVSTVTKGTLRSQIELGDAAFVVDRHNAVERRVQDRRLARLASSKGRGLCVRLLRHVDRKPQDRCHQAPATDHDGR